MGVEWFGNRAEIFNNFFSVAVKSSKIILVKLASACSAMARLIAVGSVSKSFHILSLFFRARITAGQADLFSKLPESELTDLVGASSHIRSRLVCILCHMSWELPETFQSRFSAFFTMSSGGYLCHSFLDLVV